MFLKGSTCNAPAVRGILRRGLTLKALQEFILGMVRAACHHSIANTTSTFAGFLKGKCQFDLGQALGHQQEGD